MTTAAANSMGMPTFSRAARRVRASEVKVDAYVKPDGLEYCLDCWKRWMHGDADRDLGAKTMRGLAGDSDAYGAGLSVHDAQEQEDNRIGAATDAMIESLTQLHKWAIYRSCSMATAWRFPNADLIAISAEARDELSKKLRQNPCTAIRF